MKITVSGIAKGYSNHNFFVAWEDNEKGIGQFIGGDWKSQSIVKAESFLHREDVLGMVGEECEGRRHTHYEHASCFHYLIDMILQPNYNLIIEDNDGTITHKWWDPGRNVPEGALI